MAAVVPYFRRFIERFPSVKVLAAVPLEDVLSAWTGLGYYSRAKNLHCAARLLARGGFPETYEKWLELPGVGPYTAAAIVSQCHGVREPVWDGNVLRVCARLFATKSAHSPDFRLAMRELLRERMGRADASKFNQALMELGATVCMPKSARCAVCPLERGCLAAKDASPLSYPSAKARKNPIRVECRVWVHARRNEKTGSAELWLRCREPSCWFSGLWDFPSELGGANAPLLRTQPPSPGSYISIGRSIRHQITHHRIELLVNYQLGDVATKIASKGRWFSVDELFGDRSPVPVSTTARKVLRLVLRTCLAIG